MLLYKYFSRMDFFSNFKIRITPPKELNDPREIRPKIVFINESNNFDVFYQWIVEYDISKKLDLNPSLDKQDIVNFWEKRRLQIKNLYSKPESFEVFIYEFLIGLINSKVGILSLSETNNNELMWSHYADSHKGIVIGLDSENEFFKPKLGDLDPCGKLIKVEYSDVAAEIYVEPKIEKIPSELFFTKTKIWNYECEWRMIKLLTSSDEILDKTIHLFEVPTDAIKEIIFGMKMPIEKRKEIKSKVKLKSRNIVFKEAKLDLNGKFIVI